MPTTHVVAGDNRILYGVCSNQTRGIPVADAPAAHFPWCQPSDCYCIELVSDRDCPGHDFYALSRRVVLCGNCGAAPEQPLTHGALKHARDKSRALKLRIVEAHHSPAAVAYWTTLVPLNEAIANARTPDEKAAALQTLADRVAHRRRFYPNARWAA